MGVHSSTPIGIATLGIHYVCSAVLRLAFFVIAVAPAHAQGGRIVTRLPGFDREVVMDTIVCPREWLGARGHCYRRQNTRR
ncbi:MAG: hypothetical protein ABIT38_04605 [Gemmatimonadaceae bacterium]